MAGLRTASGVLMVVAALLAYYFLAPRALGGENSYLLVSGNSMEPLIHRGDLVVLRHTGSAEVGDVVGYRSELIGQVVVHRVIGREDGHYVFKGDNNSWIDSERPTNADLVGKQWVQVGRLGRAFSWMRKPWHAGLLGGAVAATTVSAGAGAAEGRKRPGRSSVARWSSGLRGLRPPVDGDRLWGGAASVLALMAAVALLAFTRPLNDRVDERLPYTATAAFTYEGPALVPTLYDQQRVTTGDPFYSNLTPYVDVSLHSVLESRSPVRARGTAALRATVSDANGWQRTFPFGSPSTFDGPAVDTSGRLELQPIVDAIDELILQSGHNAGGYTLALAADIAIEGDLNGAPLSTVLHPNATLRVEPPNTFAILRPSGSTAATNRDLFTSTSEHSVTHQVSRPHTIGVLGNDISVRRLRQVALWGGVAVIVGGLLLVGVVLMGRDGEAEGDGKWLRRLAPRLFQAAALGHDANTPLVRLSSLEEFTRLAEALDLPVFVAPDNETGGQRFFMEDGDTCYLCEGVPGGVARLPSLHG